MSEHLKKYGKCTKAFVAAKVDLKMQARFSVLTAIWSWGKSDR